MTPNYIHAVPDGLVDRLQPLRTGDDKIKIAPDLLTSNSSLYRYLSPLSPGVERLPSAPTSWGDWTLDEVFGGSRYGIWRRPASGAPGLGLWNEWAVNEILLANHRAGAAVLKELEERMHTGDYTNDDVALAMRQARKWYDSLISVILERWGRGLVTPWPWLGVALLNAGSVMQQEGDDHAALFLWSRFLDAPPCDPPVPENIVEHVRDEVRRLQQASIGLD